MSFEIENGILKKYTGTDTAVVIPEGVTEIGERAFEGHWLSGNNITSVVIPEGVVRIGQYAFASCTSLKSIALPESMRHIDDMAFYRCRSLTSVTLNDGLESIGAKAFIHCLSLVSIRIPEGITVIEAETFNGCEALQEVTLPDSLTKIGNQAFFGTKLSKVALPETLTEIEYSAFSFCRNLTDITLPEGLSCIPKYLLSDCRMLEEVVIPKSVTSIGSEAFKGCAALKRVVIPEGVISIDDSTFEQCPSLESITLPSTLTKIGINAFSGCASLASISIPAGVTEIGKGAFSDCAALCAVSLPEGITSLETSLFENCAALTEISIPESVTDIFKSAFAGCAALQSIRLPDGLVNLGDVNPRRYNPYYLKGVLEGCTALKSVIIPKSVKKIGHRAFLGCTSLTALPENLNQLSSFIFSRCTALTDVVLPQEIKQIPSGAFCECTSLKSVTLPPDAGLIEEDAFEGCTALETIVLPEAVKTIEKNAFAKCTALRRVVLSCADIAIDANAFADCPNITAEFPADFNMRVKDKLSAPLASLNPDSDDETRAYVLLYQTTQAWLIWVCRTTQDAEAVLNACAALIAPEKKVLAASCKQVIAFMLEKEKALKPESILNMLNLLKEKKCKVDTEQFRSIAHLLSGGKKADANPIEALAAEALAGITLHDAASAVKKGTKIHYASGEGIASNDVLRLLLHESAAAWEQRKRLEDSELSQVEMLAPAKDLIFSSTAEKIIAALNRAELSAFLAPLVKSPAKYRPYMLAYARCADEDSIAEMTPQISKSSRGKAQQRYWAENMTTALLHSDTRAAMLYFDKHGMLDDYAALRGITALEVRDSHMMPEFAFDADGVKRYDIGGNIIEVTIESDLSFRLYDTAKKKVIKSMPKKSDDPEKAVACAEDFKAFKKNVQDFYKLRAAYMHNLHLSGDALSSEVWHRVYLSHPVLKFLTRLLVWQDETGRSFLPLENGIIDAQGQPYAPQGKITLGHVLSMNADDVEAWQKYLSSHAIVQPFEQMWESVVQFDPDAKDFKKRYWNVVLSKTERNALKKALGLWGINMRSAGMEREFDAGNWSYEYSNESFFIFGGGFTLDYEVDPDDGTTTLGKIGEFSQKKEDSRRINAILLHLDRAAIRSRIISGDDAAVAAALDTGFTAAQISEFVSLSTECGQTACTAILLNFKNEHFSDFADMDEFSLDW